jgi:hypothetical protein
MADAAGGAPRSCFRPHPALPRQRLTPRALPAVPCRSNRSREARGAAPRSCPPARAGLRARRAAAGGVAAGGAGTGRAHALRRRAGGAGAAVRRLQGACAARAAAQRRCRRCAAHLALPRAATAPRRPPPDPATATAPSPRWSTGRAWRSCAACTATSPPAAAWPSRTTRRWPQAAAAPAATRPQPRASASCCTHSTWCSRGGRPTAPDRSRCALAEGCAQRGARESAGRAAGRARPRSAEAARPAERPPAPPPLAHRRRPSRGRALTRWTWTRCSSRQVRARGGCRAHWRGRAAAGGGPCAWRPRQHAARSLLANAAHHAQQHDRPPPAGTSGAGQQQQQQEAQPGSKQQQGRYGDAVCGYGSDDDPAAFSDAEDALLGLGDAGPVAAAWAARCAAGAGAGGSGRRGAAPDEQLAAWRERFRGSLGDVVALERLASASSALLMDAQGARLREGEEQEGRSPPLVWTPPGCCSGGAPPPTRRPATAAPPPPLLRRPRVPVRPHGPLPRAPRRVEHRALHRQQGRRGRGPRARGAGVQGVAPAGAAAAGARRRLHAHQRWAARGHRQRRAGEPAQGLGARAQPRAAHAWEQPSRACHPSLVQSPRAQPPPPARSLACPARSSSVASARRCRT